MGYQASDHRYETMIYNRCGNSGLMLPALSLSLWHNFGGKDSFENSRSMVRYAFDTGITHFDLANNYRPPPGSPEETFGKILKKDLLPYRDELVISSKAGYKMCPGLYGNNGSRKYTPRLIHQPIYSMLKRDVEKGLLDVLHEEKIGAIVFSPLAQGLLTDRYLNGIPEDS